MSKESHTHICAHCGREFTPQREMKKVQYCSQACNHAAWYRRKRKAERAKRMAEPTMLKCPVCGREFTPIRKQKFCCDKCAHKASRLRKTGGPWTRECPICGKTFHTTKGNQKYCSCGCMEEAERRQRFASYHAAKGEAPLDTINPMLTARTPKEHDRIQATYEADMKVAMWFAYLPDAERAANIRTLTKRQRAMAERVWRDRHHGAHGANECDCGWRA